MARLAVAAILIFEATNKTSIPSVTSDFYETLASLIFMLEMKNIQRWGLTRVKWALHDKKNPFFSPKNFEIQNLPLIHLPIYKQIFFSGSSDEKNNFSAFGAKPAHGTKEFFFHLMTPKKKLAYILVNGLMANFEFRSFWAKKVDFFCHGAHTGRWPKKFFGPNFFQHTQKLK